MKDAEKETCKGGTLGKDPCRSWGLDRVAATSSSTSKGVVSPPPHHTHLKCMFFFWTAKILWTKVWRQHIPLLKWVAVHTRSASCLPLLLTRSFRSCSVFLHLVISFQFIKATYRKAGMKVPLEGSGRSTRIGMNPRCCHFWDGIKVSESDTGVSWQPRPEN